MLCALPREGCHPGMAALLSVPRSRGEPFDARNILRKEVIQPQVPLRLPCYDFTPVAELTVAGCPLRTGRRTVFG